MTETLDHLDLELRCLPGVLSVGIADSRETLVVQVLVTAQHAGGETRDQIRRVIRAHVDRPMVLELIVDGPLGVNGDGQPNGPPD